MAEHQSGDYHSCVSTLHDLLNVLYFKSGDAFDSSLDSENYRKLKEISDQVKEQEELENDNAVFEHLEDVSKVFEATINNIEKFKSEDPLEITRGVLDIISSAAQLLGNVLGVPCAGPAISALYIIIGWILTKFGKPQQPSVVDQLAKVVHEELVHFNKRLHEQKYDGLKRNIPLLVLNNMECPTSYLHFLGKKARVYTGISSQRTMGRLSLIPPNIQRLSCILIGCILYGMVYKKARLQERLARFCYKLLDHL